MNQLQVGLHSVYKDYLISTIVDKSLRQILDYKSIKTI